MGSFRIEISNKKNIYDSVSENLKKDIKDIGIEGVIDVIYTEVFTLSGGLSKKEAERISKLLLADPISQDYKVLNGSADAVHEAQTIEIAYNPGVMDPVRASAEKAIRDLGIENITVKTSKKYFFQGKVTKENIKIISDKLLYNKMIQHSVTHEETEKDLPPYEYKRVEIGIRSLSDKELSKLSIDAQLYLNLEEMKTIRKHFIDLGRNPSDCELETIAQTWSEHCKHKTMMGNVEFNGKLIKNLLKETVMKATTELDRKWCVSVFKDNAGIIEFDSKNNICFKVETHNHPSALEPYGGAETGVGGVIRDIMGTGLGAKPIANTDVFCFGIPDTPQSKIPKGALHPKRVMKGVVSGVRDYGNKMGIPTVNGSVMFDNRYTGNPLVFCGNIGIMPKKYSYKKVSPGELIVAVGGRTGRDGIHGATFSSAELTSESETISSTAVQIGNPITEKKIVDTLLKARDLDLYTAITDCGAGGFSSSVGEMGEKTGAIVNIDKAPLKYQGLKPWEIWISEAQERMVLAVKPKNLKKLLKIFADENVEAVVIGKFTNDKKLKIYYKKHLVADLDMEFIHDGLPKITRKAVWKKQNENTKINFAEKKDYSQDLLNILSSWNVCSKEWIIRQYDHEVQGGSVLKPLVGEDNDGPSDAAIIRPVLSSNKGIVISNGINPNYGDIDPYWMAASAIDEALRQIACVGGDIDKVAILDNFCWGNTDKPNQLGSLVRASQACYDMAMVYRTPFISGKDSLNNEFNTGKNTVAIPATILISAFGVIDDVNRTISSDFKKPGNLIYVIGSTYNEMGGSQYFKIRNSSSGKVPRVYPKESLKYMKALKKAISERSVISAHDCSDGGLATAISEMMIGGNLGAKITLKTLPREKEADRNDVMLFSESNSRFLVEVPEEKKTSFENAMKNIPIGCLGEVALNKKLLIDSITNKRIVDVSLSKIKTFWKKTLGKAMHEEC
ncbi:MAG: phosphoribosylformylglycinamidine synthase subunit PurL [Candidatus Omnitrophica bacterium]|nr:phosphoribosylformylglycinamidine synthase subunit PurL [Candidatus Omnitrophota bacterium]